jgi:quercetin dioxygenase-like cupin family protein
MSLRSNFAADTLEVLKDRIGQSTRAGTEASTPNGWPPFKTGRRAIVQITRNSNETAPGPSEWFTGTVYIDAVATPLSGSHLHASSVHFTPGARTAWHTHPKGQTIWVTEGVGLAQRRGGPIEVIGPGDRVFFEPGEDHWHGAAPNRFMTHLAMLEVDETGDIATWGDQVTDEEYAEAPPIDG